MIRFDALDLSEFQIFCHWFISLQIAIFCEQNQRNVYPFSITKEQYLIFKRIKLMIITCQQDKINDLQFTY